MSDVIHLAVERHRRERPDPEHVMRDDFGREMFRFLLAYRMDGSEWTFTIWAYSEEDAQSRVRAMLGTLTYEGQVFATLPA